MIQLIGLDKEELYKNLSPYGFEKYKIKQLWNWIYNKGQRDFTQMTDLSKKHISILHENFTLERPNITLNKTSFDNTRKWLIKYQDNQEVETVYIPETDRGTLCVSSQVGCTLSCKFCHTGTQTLVRNLTAYDIISQVMIAKDELNDWQATNPIRLLSNIVMMGMGEPLYNFDNVKKSLLIIMDNEGISLSKRRITLSTSGVVPYIEQCGKELGVNLAVSLHAVNNTLRDEIVPINKKYPLEELLKACRNYPAASNCRRITFEYVMLKGINDSLSDAKELVRLIKGIPAKINLIPFNPWPGTIYECSDWKTIKTFAQYIENAGYSSPIRKTRGDDIGGACGQLKSESKRESKSKLKNMANEDIKAG